MKPWRVFVIAIMVAATAGLHGQSTSSFAGKWALNTGKSRNLGMMATLEDTLTISQTSTELVIKDDSSFQGRQNSRELHYNLTGKSTTNEGPMGDRNETVAKWIDGKLVTTWTRDGAVAGTTSVMTETRSLSADGKTMTVESARGSNPPLVMVFDKR
ncbi:MAG TPA: hypothetical protein VF219_08320 [Vicinamibacterales bacterium]